MFLATCGGFTIVSSSLPHFLSSRLPFPHFCLPFHVSKPKNRRVKRALEARAPKLIENTKSALFVRGGHTSGTVTQALKDVVSVMVVFQMLKSPACKVDCKMDHLSHF